MLLNVISENPDFDFHGYNIPEKFRKNRTIRCHVITKTKKTNKKSTFFNMASVRHPEFEILNFGQTILA